MNLIDYLLITGLYLPKQQQWLDDSMLISDVQSAISNEVIKKRGRFMGSSRNCRVRNTFVKCLANCNLGKETKVGGEARNFTSRDRT
jgi:hypothetical protein